LYITGGLCVHPASPTETGALDPSRRSSNLGTPLEPYGGGRVSTAHPLQSSVVNTDASQQTTAACFSATEALLPAIDTICPPTREACRGVDASPLCERGQDWHNKGKWCVPLGAGCLACFGKRTFTGGARVQGPWCATCDGIRARFLDVLPVTIRASYVGHCPGLPLPISKSL
jgi:hypothetical protein